MASRLTRVLQTGVAIAALAAPLSAEVLVPTTTADDFDGVCDRHCSLREAVAAANSRPGADVILLGPGVYELSRAGGGEDEGATGDLDIEDELTLHGAGADRTAIDARRIDRVVHVLPEANVIAQGITFRNGEALAADGGGLLNLGSLTLRRVQVTASGAGNRAGSPGAGGGVASDGALRIEDSTIFANVAGTQGGGVVARGSLTMINVTVHGNETDGRGGGMFARDGLEGTVNNATITDNFALAGGGGIWLESTPFITIRRLRFRNSLLAGNSGQGAEERSDCKGAVVSDGHNLLGNAADCIDFKTGKGDVVGSVQTPLDPRLAGLGEWGGPTPTNRLLPGLAVDAGSPAAAGEAGACAAADQRGIERQGRCDIGAFEVSPACAAGARQLCLSDSRFRVTATFRGASPARAVTLTSDAGYLWFFHPDNPELLVKVLDGCALNQRFWVLVAGLTNVELALEVVDTVSGKTRTYRNPKGQVFRTRLDTAAFATCSP